MAFRAEDADVRAVIATDASISVLPFITVANRLVTYVDGKDTDGDLSDAELRDLEIWLAAHFYAIRDQPYASESTADASAVYQGKTGMGLDSTHWGQMAKLIDTTGTLATLDQQSKKGKKVATATWLGKVPSGQTDYIDRD